jgi:sulfate adenylyltransferase
MTVGITLFFTGLSGAGKSTLASIIQTELIEDGQRLVTLLDGDVVRQNLSSELGYSRADRDLNIRRIGFAANEISENGEVAVCAFIAPYRAIRREIRALIEQHGVFIEIYLSTPLAVCEERDSKGLYAKARAGEILQFTGVSDPYESPERAELVIDTSKTTPTEACQQILDYLRGRGLIGVSRK